MPLKLRRGGRNGNERLYTAHIKLLDNTVIDINLALSSKGRDCVEKISQIIGLQEVNYFGLQFLTKKDKLRWVEPDKCLRKQLDRHAANKGKVALLVFKVQFFVTNIHPLRQEITRYLYYLQLKTLILNGRLKCQLNIALKLAGYAVQAELGDYDLLDHPSEYLSEFLLLPDHLTDGENFDELNKEIKIIHQENSGLTANVAEKSYIQLCQQLDGYGVEFFTGKDKDGNLINIGPCCAGIKVVYIHQNKSPYSLYRWQNISNMAFNRQNFVFSTIQSTDTISSLMEDMESSKTVWRNCVKQHQFFRISNTTIGKTTFRTQQEITSDPKLFIKIQQSPTIKRRLTLTKRRAKMQQKSDRSQRSKNSDSSSEAGMGNGIGSALVDETLDETEFLHRYEDICDLTRSRSDSSASRGSTPTNSEYNTSDSESEADSKEFRIHPIAPPINNTSSNFRPVSLIFTRLSKIENRHRDLLMRHLEGVFDDNEFAQEFQEIFQKKVGADFTTALENISSNRNVDILPYEDNRVLLNPKNNYEATNYINASPIQMNVGKNTFQFIVAQSPLKETVNNFWQMIWEKNVCVIAMISKSKENGLSRCWEYWPEDNNNRSTVTFGQVSVTSNFNNFFAAYSIRSLHVQHVASKESRTIFQIQYIQWPEDGGVPMWSKPVIEFLNEIHSVRKVSYEVNSAVPSQPLLVHCHNGAGRSGVVVLAETLLSIIENNETLDVPLTLAQLRSQRMSLVESDHEYTFVYQLLIDNLKRNRLI